MTASETSAAGADPAPIRLADVGDPCVEELGGKAASLVRLARAGFRVPAAAVLPASWFAPWWAELERSEAWSRFRANGEAPWTEPCRALQAEAARLPYTDGMRAGLEELRALVASWGSGAVCAVRSSSPDEDLEGASFAGGYATRLGVPAVGIEDAVRACFASCLDERVVLYKAQHGLDVHRPRIAVIVQRQLESDVSGVGFSLNPVTNDYDEAVIDASFGLGEAVVSGEVSPDHFVVDKPGRVILERRLGSKRVSRRIRPGGGVERREEAPGTGACLEEARVLEIAGVLARLEQLYGHPVDVEWAYAQGELHLLQARPITTHFPLPAEMQTEPGAPRRLYFDGSLNEKFTINAPLTELSLDGYKQLMRRLTESYHLPFSVEERPLEDFLIFRGSRMYGAFSDALWLVTPQKLAGRYELMDYLFSRTLAAVDGERYRPKRKPEWMRWRKLLRAALGVARGNWRMGWHTLLALVAPSRYLRRYRQAVEGFEAEARAARRDAPLAELHALHQRALDVIMHIDIPTVLAWFAAVSLLERLARRADPETRELLDRMGRGFEGELVIEMGIEMFAMSRLLEAGELDDLERLAKRLEARELPAAFLAAWDAFVLRFGARAPLEMELASPRYGDDPKLLLRQLSLMARAAPGDDPRLVHERHVAERRAAFAELDRRLRRGRRWLLRLAHRWTEAFAGERDTAKYHWVLAAYAMRRGALARAERLVAAGRLDAADDVFHLSFAELEAAERDPAFDVRTPALERRGAFRRLARQLEFPHLIDSRGRILRPPPPADEAGALCGIGVSPGVARGPVKVLANPYDKAVEPGDVLVAFTTDPGWTPLFVNASAIVLQIGGMMQHGGVVAREYGKPCVAGIEHVLTRFSDGQWVEVDGSAGVVRTLEV